MTDFEKRLEIDKNTKEKINNTEEKHKKSNEEQAFRDKIALSICQAIDSIEAKTKQEEITKAEYMLNINKIIRNYEEQRPILTEYFENKKEKWR